LLPGLALAGTKGWLTKGRANATVPMRIVHRQPKQTRLMVALI